MEEDETLFVLLPAIDVLEMIQTIAEYKWEVLLLNLALFLANHMAYNRLTMAALTVVLHWGDQGLWQRCHILVLDLLGPIKNLTNICKLNILLINLSK
jgi:hypothetical protein